MTTEDLREIIENCGLISGFNSDEERLDIISKGYQILGKVYYKEPFNIHLNKHFYRQVSKEHAIQISRALWEYVKTPVKERGI